MLKNVWHVLWNTHAKDEWHLFKLVLLEWFMVNDRKRSKVTPSCVLRLSLQKTMLPLISDPKFLGNDFYKKKKKKIYRHQLCLKKKKKTKTHSSAFQQSEVWNVKMVLLSLWHLLCVMTLPPAVHITYGGIIEQEFHPGCDCASCLWVLNEGQWSMLSIRNGDTVQVHW